jgi:hypothetical protein
VTGSTYEISDISNERDESGDFKDSTMNRSPTFSIISVYNDREVLENMLLSGLESEPDELYECVLQDNRDNKYSDAASALNAGATDARGEYYIFVHQDVKFLGEDWLATAKAYVEEIDDVGLAGITGMAAEGIGPYQRARHTLEHGDEREPWAPGTRVKQPERIQTVDECCFIIPSVVFSRHRFDEELCDGWHLYAVEYCLRLREQTDHVPYVLPLDIWHGSTGMNIDKSYYRTLERLAVTYQTKIIYTTCGAWPTARWYQRLMQWLWCVSMRIVPAKYTKTIMSFWPIVWGGVIPLLFEVATTLKTRISNLFRKGDQNAK